MLEFTRRELIQSAIAAAGLMAVPSISNAASTNKSIVYWTPELSSKALLRLYGLINGDITGRVALKLHTGEPSGPNIFSSRMDQRVSAQCASKHNCRVKCSLQEPSPDDRGSSQGAYSKRLEFLPR